MNINEIREYVNNNFDVIGTRLKDNECEFLYAFKKNIGKFINLAIKNIESHSGSSSDGKYEMTTETFLSFLNNGGIKKLVKTHFDDNTSFPDEKIVSNNARTIINTIKEVLPKNYKAFDSVKDIIDILFK